MCDIEYSHRVVCYVIVHHDDDLRVRYAVATEDLVGVADIRLTNNTSHCSSGTLARRLEHTYLVLEVPDTNVYPSNVNKSTVKTNSLRFPETQCLVTVACRWDSNK